MLKICSRCKANKPFGDFAKASNKKLGIRPACKSCEQVNSRDQKLRQQYGISEKQFNELLACQGGCAICGQIQARMAVDHDHKCCPTKAKSCGKCIRAILCMTCNVGLGQFKDDPNLLLAAAEYLKGTM